MAHPHWGWTKRAYPEEAEEGEGGRRASNLAQRALDNDLWQVAQCALDNDLWQA